MMDRGIFTEHTIRVVHIASLFFFRIYNVVNGGSEIWGINVSTMEVNSIGILYIY